MKKQLYFMTKEKGFILPYTLFITTIILLLLTASINIYSREVQMTHQAVEQLKLETLFQMGRTKFKNELSTLNSHNDTIVYTFPDGTVEIEYIVGEDDHNLHFTIYTKNNSVISRVNTLKTY